MLDSTVLVAVFLICNIVFIRTNNVDGENFSIKAKLSPVLASPFQSIVTLGSNCLAKQSVNFFLTQNEHLNVTSVNHSLDWVVIRNYTALGEAIRNNFDDLVGRDIFSVGPHFADSRRMVLINDKYDVYFSHAFDGYDRYVSHHRQNTLLNEDRLKAHYHLIDKKLQYLTQKSRETMTTSDKTLYVVYNGSLKPKTDALRHEDFLHLLNSIKNQRNDNFLLLVIIPPHLSKINYYEFDTLIENNLYYHRMDFFMWNQRCHSECVRQWSNILSAILS